MLTLSPRYNVLWKRNVFQRGLSTSGSSMPHWGSCFVLLDSSANVGYRRRNLVGLSMSHWEPGRRCFSSVTAATDSTSISTIMNNTSSPSDQSNVLCGGGGGVGVGFDVLNGESDPQKLLDKLGMPEKELYELASQRPTPLRLVDMYNYAIRTDQRLRNAQFLHKELPIRLAQRAVDLLTLPHGLSQAIPIRQVVCAYILKLHTMRSRPMPNTVQEEELFTDLLQSLVLDRSSIPRAIAKGLDEWRKDQRGQDLEADRLQEMEQALYRFFMARVGLRLLTEHHILSSQRECATALRNVTCLFPDNQQKQPGVIQPNVDLIHEISRVADLVVEQTKDFYGASPEIQVVDCMEKGSTGDFTYVPNHLHYMMEQLLKNSCRAVIRHHLGQLQNEHLGSLSLRADNAAQKLSPIRIVIVKGDEDVTIKVADRGGGIPRSKMANIWRFAHSTADETESASAFGMDNLSGFHIRGFGLPLCRIYARYLGGELTLKSMEGYGLDAYLHLPRLGVACENLPRLVRFSPGERDSLPTSLRSKRNFSSRSMNHPPSNEEETNAGNQNGGSAENKYTTDRLMEELRHCVTQEAKNTRIWEFLRASTRAW